jgi:hypothetical protein
LRITQRNVDYAGGTVVFIYIVGKRECDDEDDFGVMYEE